MNIWSSQKYSAAAFIVSTFVIGGIANAKNKITPIESAKISAYGCEVAKAETLEGLSKQCIDGDIDSITCSNQDLGTTKDGHFCTVICDAYCITH